MSNLLSAASRAIASCRGDHLVASFFSADEHARWFAESWYLIAVGKAAGAMAAGALCLGHKTLVCGLVVSKTDAHDWVNDNKVSCYQAGHPVPNEASFVAGNALLQFVTDLPAHAKVLFLLSGGASALVEVLSDSMDADAWQGLTREWLASGWDIARINQERKRLSHIKGGRLLSQFPESCTILQLVISDVQGDDVATIGSGLLAGHSEQRKMTSIILANNQKLLSELAKGLPNAKMMPQFVCCSVEDLAQEIVSASPQSGCTIWGGEPVVVLPQHVGRGGRMQHLALWVAWLLRDYASPWQLLAMGSDGSDGATEDAGALVNQDSIQLSQQLGWDIEHTLASFDAGSLLEDIGALITTGDTGSNVNDMIILECH